MTHILTPERIAELKRFLRQGFIQASAVELSELIAMWESSPTVCVWTEEAGDRRYWHTMCYRRVYLTSDEQRELMEGTYSHCPYCGGDIDVSFDQPETVDGNPSVVVYGGGGAGIGGTYVGPSGGNYTPVSGGGGGGGNGGVYTAMGNCRWVYSAATDMFRSDCQEYVRGPEASTMLAAPRTAGTCPFCRRSVRVLPRGNTQP